MYSKDKEAVFKKLKFGIAENSLVVNAPEEYLPLLGHRNWILVVDKAFPAQNFAGIQVVDTGKELLTVSGMLHNRFAVSEFNGLRSDIK